MDEKLQRLLGDAARVARLLLGLTQAEVAKKVRLKSGVYGQVERGLMTPSVPRCGACARPWASPRTCSCPWETKSTRRRHRPRRPCPRRRAPELSRIIHILKDWPPERLALLRKLLETVDTNLSGES